MIFDVSAGGLSYKVSVVEDKGHGGYRARLISPSGVIMEPHNATKIGAIQQLINELKLEFSSGDRAIAKAIQKELDTALLKTHEKPLAAHGLKSYRYKGPYGFIMIGAINKKDALREAARSTSGKISAKNLQVWDGEKYKP